MYSNNTNATILNSYQQSLSPKLTYIPFPAMVQSQFLTMPLHNSYLHFKPNKILLLHSESLMTTLRGNSKGLY